jgi:hypothetical protein
MFHFDVLSRFGVMQFNAFSYAVFNRFIELFPVNFEGATIQCFMDVGNAFLDAFAAVSSTPSAFCNTGHSTPTIPVQFD